MTGASRPGWAVGLALGFLVLLVGSSSGDDRTPRVHALVDARVVVHPDKILERATVVVRDGVVTEVGDVQPPADARIWDLRGRTLYPGLIEAYFDPEAGKRGKERSRDEARESSAKGGTADEAGMRHPNAKVRAESRVAETLQLDDETLEELRAAGFAMAHLVPSRGIFRGQSAVVSLRPGEPRAQILRADVAQIVAFESGSWGDESYRRNPTYPGSLMGAVALVRQTLLDAGWARAARQKYEASPAGTERPQTNLSIDVLAVVLPPEVSMPVWLLTEDVLGTLRSQALAREFELQAVLIGNGEEYQELSQIQGAGFPVVVPVSYPEPPRFEDDDEALDVELEELRHWNAAPTNLARLHAAGVSLALTSNGLEKRGEFRAHVARAVEEGLPEPVALAAVTTVPARLLGLEKQVGTIERGKVASFTVSDGDLFDESTRILEIWVDGDRYEVRDAKRDAFDRVAGNWLIHAGGQDEPQWKLELAGNQWTLRGTLSDAGGSEIPLRQLRWQQGELQLQFGPEAATEELRLRSEKKGLRGTWWQRDGKQTEVEATRPEPGGAR